MIFEGIMKFTRIMRTKSIMKFKFITKLKIISSISLEVKASHEDDHYGGRSLLLNDDVDDEDADDL